MTPCLKGDTFSKAHHFWYLCYSLDVDSRIPRMQWWQGLDWDPGSQNL